VATRVRDWATLDYYAMLGVAPNASGDDIARAFRAVAKQSHPDATDDPEAGERFKDLAAAYTVLSDRRARRDYDRVRASVVLEPPRPGTSAPPAPGLAVRPATRRASVRKPWSRRRCWTVIVAGIVVTLLGFAAVYVTWHLHDVDASQRARFVPVTARRLDNGDIAFTTRSGQQVVTQEPVQHGEGTSDGPTTNVRYDPARPAHVIVDAGTFGRDITLAIVAIKMLVGGPVFLGYGWSRLKKAPTAVR
jgi:hypothetical protein